MSLNQNKTRWFSKSSTKQIVALFFAVRLILFVSSPYEIIPGYGDYWNFFSQATLGIPYLHFWTEYPPIFPFISKLIYIIVGGRENAYGYGLAMIISLFQAGTLAIFVQIGTKLNLRENNISRVWVYFALTGGLFYSWSYFDPMTVFFMLLGIYWILDGKDMPAALSLAAGILTKWFPILVLPALWKTRSSNRALQITLVVIIIVVLVWGGLYLANPDMTVASLASQVNKGSWETIWALLDNNDGTGNFSPEINRKITETAYLRTGNPPLVPSWVTLIVFCGIGLYLLMKAKNQTGHWLVSFIGLTIVIFFLWSPGYSPQWVLYLLPFILLCLPNNEAYLLAAVLILVNLLEWPVLLSRGNFGSLNYIIPLRTALVSLLGIRLYQRSIGKLEIGTG
jgi:hypothetical protein